EGCVRHVSVHAAGVVIAPKPLYEFTPIQMDPKGGDVITQYDMYQIEDVGLPKFDFLGIRNLSILADAVKIVKRTKNVDVDLDTVDIADKKTFDLLATGQTEGLFQLNGSGMTAYLKQLKPTTIHDINAMVALYRPGPMQFIPLYIERKYNPRLIKYLDPALEPILKQTYGVLVYQDDLLMIAIQIAGYSWGEADKFRKAVGKKIPEEMAKQKDHFISGCIEHSGWPLKKAQELWAWIEPFAAYGFNKAHSASYGRVAYLTAYMKANFPCEYMTAILTAESGDVEKISEIVHECSNMNIKVLPPDVNASFKGFTYIDENTIRFGLYTIKNLGSDIGEAIIEERKKNGPYESIGNFLERVQHKNLNKKSMEALIKSGSMDAFGERGQLLNNLE
ncbi:MAG: DNA polymerase III subunit alpha, partial [Candidatus Paceibacterota bacterium]